ncbi:hypothetical protein BXZ70DRAFT_646924 [Cristinia sonorae]|uniref:Uncharacterized protein n=1 Tax=Cristinia sonorae TaxID=1940300 RepID=A0A8K0XKC0_9AGAR|nr:hypothetical protein BXZ70DRAFT_646924 [Cristinia sonorae]
MSKITVTPPSIRLRSASTFNLHHFVSATALVDHLHSSASALHMFANFVSAHFKMSGPSTDMFENLDSMGAPQKKPRLSASEAVNLSGMEAPSKRLPSTSLWPSLKVPTSTVDVPSPRPEQALVEPAIEHPTTEDPPLAAPERRTRRGRLHTIQSVNYVEYTSPDGRVRRSSRLPGH